MELKKTKKVSQGETGNRNGKLEGKLKNWKWGLDGRNYSQTVRLTNQRPEKPSLKRHQTEL